MRSNVKIMGILNGIANGYEQSWKRPSIACNHVLIRSDIGTSKKAQGRTGFLSRIEAGTQDFIFAIHLRFNVMTGPMKRAKKIVP